MKNYELQAFLQFDDGSSGNAAANKSLNVTIARNGSGDATIYQDADGNNEIQRPFETDQYGRFKFYAPNGYYNILFDDPDVANLNNLLDRDIFAVEEATTSTAGLVELATQSEMDNGAAGVVPTADIVKEYVDNQSGSGEANTTSSQGGTVALTLSKDGVNLPFRGLSEGSNVTLTILPDGSVEISSTGGAAGTDLSYTADANQGTVVSSSGSNAIIPSADTNNAGLMTPTQLDTFNDKEDSLNNPTSNGQILASQTDGTRSWIDPPSGGGGGKSLPYTMSGTGFEVIGVGGRRGTTIQIQVPVSLSAVPSSVTAIGTLRGSFYRNDTNNVGSQTFDAATDLTYQAANSTPDMLFFSATVVDSGWTAWGNIAGNGTAWSLTLNA